MAELVGQACSPLLDKAACPLWLTLLSPPVPSPGMALPSFHSRGARGSWGRGLAVGRSRWSLEVKAIVRVRLISR